MSKNILVISVDIRETRVALIEGGIIAELHLERKGHNNSSGTVGNVVLGKVTRVLPGLQAAFIDIGQERAAFLHVEDLIRPDDFDAYLAGGRKAAAGGRDQEVGPTGDEELDAEAEAVIESAPPMPAGGGLGGLLAVPVSTPSMPDIEAARDSDPESDPDLAQASGDAEGDVDDQEITRTRFVTELERGSGESIPPSPDSDDSGDDLELGGDQTDSDADDDDDLAPTSDERPTLDMSAEDRLTATAGEIDDPESSPPPPPVVMTTMEDDDVEGVRPTLRPRPKKEKSEHPIGDAIGEVIREVIVSAAAEALPEFPDMPGFTIHDPNDPTPKAPPPPRAAGGRGGDRGRGFGGGRGRGRGRGRGGEGGGGRGREGGGGGGGRESGARHEGGSGERSARESGGGGGGGGRSRGRGDREGGRSGVPNRISKSTPIRDVVREGQEIIVQVTKDPIGTKGARCSSHISLPGRYVVYLPTVDHVGISKRIGSEKERSRLREAIEGMKPPSGGLIVRTVAEGLTKKQLKQDVGYLVRLWGEIAKKKEGARSPSILSTELDLVLKTARDLFTDEVHQIVIDDKHQYERLCRFVEMFAPERLKDIQYYSGDEPIFDAYGIEDEIARALSRKVPLPSGGHLVIDQAEALTAIDVNTGRFVGKGSKDMEETILKTNLEAVNEIAYQLRFRNIGGLIILDLIDMERHGNREKVRRTLEDLLQKDKAKTTLNRISDLGLIEMTRKRTRESLGRLLHEPCFYCDGTGQLQSKQTIALEILREIRRKRADLPGYTVVVNAHPAVADLLTGSEKDALIDAENRWHRKITVVAQKGYHLEQFDLVGK